MHRRGGVPIGAPPPECDPSLRVSLRLPDLAGACRWHTPKLTQRSSLRLSAVLTPYHPDDGTLQLSEIPADPGVLRRTHRKEDIVTCARRPPDGSSRCGTAYYRNCTFDHYQKCPTRIRIMTCTVFTVWRERIIRNIVAWVRNSRQPSGGERRGTPIEQPRRPVGRASIVGFGVEAELRCGEVRWRPLVRL